ncbi:sulfotransferase [Rugosimonospora acidiphila]|uniref:Sulfotransferase n=1 Tax=Rugosimonospora acidiphila TaxID=556531 RepID=A0ABP9RJQ2_9ACTN
MVRVIFIGGLGRSGTTLLERVLGELPGVCALGEVVHLWRRDLCDDERCGCGRRFSGCRFWSRVGERAFGGWQNIDPVRVMALRDAVERSRHIPRLAGRRLADPHGELVAEYATYYARLYRGAAQVSGAGAVVDSSKHASLAYCLRWSDQIDLRVVHMVRDSRGVAYSWARTPDRPASAPARPDRYQPGRAAMLWNAHNAAFGLLRRRGVPVHRVQYERLLADPAATVRRIAEFAELGDPGPLDFLDHDAVRLGPCHSAGGNPMRFATGELPLLRDEGWRASIPPRQRRLVGALTAPLLTMYGYGRQ